MLGLVRSISSFSLEKVIQRLDLILFRLECPFRVYSLFNTLNADILLLRRVCCLQYAAFLGQKRPRPILRSTYRGLFAL